MNAKDIKERLDILWKKSEEICYLQMGYPANNREVRLWLKARVRIYSKLVETYNKNLKEIM